MSDWSNHCFYIAVASGLKARGHRPVIATIGMYKEKIEALGIDFRPVRAVRVERPDGDLMKQAMDSKKGTEFIVRNLLMPTLRDAYDDTFAAADGADLIVTHPMTYATRLVAEKKGLRWVATMLAPMGFFSAYDPPVLPLPFLARLRFLGPAFDKPLLHFLKWTVRSWGEPWHRLRSDLGLLPAADPMFEGMVSPDLCLGMFSELLGAKQPDWPAHAEITGFPFYDKHGDSGRPATHVVLGQRPAASGLHPGNVGGDGRRAVLRGQRGGGTETRQACRSPDGERPANTPIVAAGRRHRCRLRPFFRVVSPCRCYCSPGRRRDDGAGHAWRASDAGGAFRP